MQLQVREKDSRSVWYNTVTGTFIVSSPSCSVQRDKYNGAMALYNSWIDSDEEKESKNMIDLAKDNIAITNENKKENEIVENITLDKINEMIRQYVQQEIDAREVNVEKVVNNYLENTDDEAIIEKLEEFNILDAARENWEVEALSSTDFYTIDELIEAYDNAVEKLENIASTVSDLKYELSEYM